MSLTRGVLRFLQKTSVHKYPWHVCKWSASAHCTLWASENLSEPCNHEHTHPVMIILIIDKPNILLMSNLCLIKRASWIYSGIEGVIIPFYCLNSLSSLPWQMCHFSNGNRGAGGRNQSYLWFLKSEAHVQWKIYRKLTFLSLLYSFPNIFTHKTEARSQCIWLYVGAAPLKMCKSHMCPIKCEAGIWKLAFCLSHWSNTHCHHQRGLISVLICAHTGKLLQFIAPNLSKHSNVFQHHIRRVGDLKLGCHKCSLLALKLESLWKHSTHQGDFLGLWCLQQRIVLETKN